MSNDKIEFDKTGIPSELVSDNGSSYQSAKVRCDYKSSKEIEAAPEKKKLASNGAFIGKTDKQG